MALACGLPHPDFLLPVLTYKQFLDCGRFYEQEPWGGDRDDARQEVFRLRLLLGLFGDGSEKMPSYEWPYSPPEEQDPQQQLEELRAKAKLVYADQMARVERIMREKALGNGNSSTP